MHHIISDGVSIGIMYRELALFYSGKELPYFFLYNIRIIAPGKHAA